MKTKNKVIVPVVIALLLGLVAGWYAATQANGAAAPAVDQSELLAQYENGYKEGYEAGYNEGFDAGKTEGYNTGFDEGYAGGTLDATPAGQSSQEGSSAASETDIEKLVQKYKASTYVCPSNITVKEDGWYYSKDEVGLYIHTFGKLPENFLSKKQAKALGWSSGSLEKYAPGKVIGGSQFGNNEGLLPKAKGRTYTECDIDTKGEKTRGAKRIVFSNDGLVFYTDDHYETYELLYGKELL